MSKKIDLDTRAKQESYENFEKAKIRLENLQRDKETYNDICRDTVEALFAPKIEAAQREYDEYERVIYR